MIQKVFGLALLVGCSRQRVIPVHEDSEPNYSGVQIPPSPVTTSSPIFVTYAPSEPYTTGSPVQQSTLVTPYDLEPVWHTPNALPKEVSIRVPLDTPLQTGAYLEKEYNNYPKYEFAYKVEDRHTGDIHSQRESRNGDLVHGEYSFHESDGTIRTVTYTVDKRSGFNAVVKRTEQEILSKPIQRDSIVHIPKPVDKSDHQYQ